MAISRGIFYSVLRCAELCQPVQMQSVQFAAITDGVMWRWFYKELEDAKLIKNESLPPKVPTGASNDETEQTNRSCRMRIGSEINQFGDATELLLFLLEYCAGKHHHGEQAYLQSIARPLSPKTTYKAIIAPNEPIEDKLRRRNYSGRDYKGYRIFNNLNNLNKIEIVKLMLEACAFSDNSSPTIGGHIGIELPNTHLKISD